MARSTIFTADRCQAVLLPEAVAFPEGVRQVEIVQVVTRTIPAALQDAMSREAQAEREHHARVILSAAEAEIAGKFAEAARTCADNPVPSICAA
jgi:virulence-associated protein VagC